MQSIQIGIDVGWSERRRTCGVAIRGTQIDGEYASHKKYDGDVPIHVYCFTLTELLNFLDDLSVKVRESNSEVVLVIDGPLGPKERPTEDRFVDSACARGAFNRRAQPNRITDAQNGKIYVNTTYSILERFLDPLKMESHHPWPWSSAQNGGSQLLIAETHPTVGMALMLEHQTPDSLPARKRPMVWNYRTYRAKSDWYWRIVAKDIVAKILEVPSVATDSHHERVAALYCLSVAARLADHQDDQLTVCAIGRDDGVYVVPSCIHANWKEQLKENNLVYRGTAQFPEEAIAQIALPGLDEIAVLNLDDNDTIGKNDDDLLLTLNDNGGIWESVNPWLEGLESPVRLQIGIQEIEFVRTNNPIQWNPLGAETTLRLAKNDGYWGSHLSNENPWGIPARILS